MPRNPLKRDPTRTTMLRRRFMTDMRLRFREIRKRVRLAVVDEDVFGLQLVQAGFLPTINRRFDFATDAEKVKAFRAWFKEQVDEGVLGIVGGVDPAEPWTSEYTTSAYREGVVRAYAETKRNVPAGDFYEGSREQFLLDAFNTPVATNQIELLSTRAFENLRGITEAMSTQITRELASGLANGLGPREIARRMSKTITGLEKKRALVLARTETIHAFAEGQLDSFERLGVDELGVMAEWSTAGDDRVCPLCASLEGVVMSVKEARGLIPRHPNCRCAWIPANVGESDSRRAISKSAVETSVRRSIQAERPNLSFRQAKGRSTWLGADRKFKGSKFVDLGPNKRQSKIKPPPKPPTRKSKPKQRQTVEARKLPPQPAKPKVQAPSPPKHITHTQRQVDEFTAEIWELIGENGVEDFEHAQRVGERLLQEAEKRAGPVDRSTLIARRSEVESERNKLLFNRTKRLTAKQRERLDSLNSEWNDLSRNMREVERATADLSDELRRVVRRVRDFGDEAMTNLSGATEAKALAQKAADQLPADWMRGVKEHVGDLEVKRLTRGYFSPKDKVLAISEQGAAAESVAAHELTHAVEHIHHIQSGNGVPNRLRSILEKWRRKRVGTEQLSEIYKGSRELGWKDEFTSHYIGKHYADQHFNEVLTMGVEGVLYNKYKILARDRDMTTLILGLLVGL